MLRSLLALPVLYILFCTMCGCVAVCSQTSPVHSIEKFYQRPLGNMIFFYQVNRLLPTLYPIADLLYHS